MRWAQRAARLVSPKVAHRVWSALPDGTRMVLEPHVHGVAVGARGERGRTLVVPPAAAATRFAVVVPAPLRGHPDVLRLEADGLRVVALADGESPVRLAGRERIGDAVLVGADAATRSAARALGWRSMDLEAATDTAALEAAFPLVSIVVVTHVRREHCIACLDAITRHVGWGRYEVIVVDNGPDDAERARLRTATTRVPHLRRLVENATNVGFAAACNQGVRDAGGDVILLLNDDAVVAPGLVSRLVGALERDEQLAAVCPVTNEIDDSARVEAAYRDIEELSGLAFARGEREAGNVRKVDRIALFCAALRRAPFEEVGLLDERYEVGLFEDDDLCRALRLRGHAVGIAEDAFVHHVGHASFGRLDDDAYLAIWTRNRVRFEQKWGIRWAPPEGARRRVELGPRGPVTVALATYLFLICAYFMPAPSSWSTASRYALTRAIVERHSFEITTDASITGDRARVGDRYFSEKAPLPSFLAVPALAVQSAFSEYVRGRESPTALSRKRASNDLVRRGVYASSLFTSGLAFALLGVALYEVVRRRAGEHAGCATAIVTMVGTPLLPYGASFFGHTVAAAFLFGGFALAMPFERLRGSAWRLIAAGACLGAAIGCEYVCALPVALVAAAIVGGAPSGERVRALGRLVAGAVLPLALVGFYHASCFGAPWRTGYSFVDRAEFAAGHHTGLLGISWPRPGVLAALLFGRARGLCYVAPVSAVALLGLVLAWRRARDRTTFVALGAVAALFLANAGYFQWDGGWAIGPRHAVPALGFLGLGVAHALSAPRLRVWLLVLALPSMAAMVLLTAVGLEAPPGVDVLGGYLVPALRGGHVARLSGASNWGLELGLGRGASLVPILAWVVLGAAWLLAHCRPPVQEAAEGGPEAEERQQTREAA